MASNWEDFRNPDSNQKEKPPIIEITTDKAESGTRKDCDWGFDGPECDADPTQTNSENSKFIELYERYLSDKQSTLDNRTRNHQMYANNPSKALREWFDQEGHEYSQKLEQTRDSQFKCSIDVPVGEQDFTFESEAHAKRQLAVDEACLAACKLLDECDLLKSWLQDTGAKDLDRKRRIEEANKEDDIELDQTTRCFADLQEPKLKRNTHESLKAKWTQLNMTILSLKAKLVKMDLSVSRQQNHSQVKDDQGHDDDDDDEEEDPLDAFMSNLDKKSGLTLNEKIEKSRLKSQISSLEREQEEISELINEINS